MKKKILYCLGICFFVLSMSGTAMTEPVRYELDWTDAGNLDVGINVPNLEYQFTFECIVPPTETFGSVPHGVDELQGGVLFLQHENGQFGRMEEAIGVYIDDVYFGPKFIHSNPDGNMEGIFLDWHQLNSIASDGVAIVRIVNTPGVGEGTMVKYGRMLAWLVYDGIPGDCNGGDGDDDGVPDGVDNCPDTPAGAVVDDTGCSIADLCPCENQPPWKNHGEYVSCTTRTAESFVKQGLITKAEKDAIVSSAAQSSCGEKK